jgi:hypothetical protein
MTPGINELRLAYKKAVGDWVAAIRAEEALATTDHSMTAMEQWDVAHFKEQGAQNKAKKLVTHTKKHCVAPTTDCEQAELMWVR